MEEEIREPGAVRTNDQLRSDIDKGMSEVQSTKDPWGDALQRQQRERNSQNGVSTYGQMKELVGRQELAELQNGQRAQDAIASALAIAEQNGGKLPSVVTDYLNRQFGFDGQTSGIIDGGIDPKTGDFGFVFGERDEAGNTTYRKQMIPLSVQLGLKEGYPSLFNEDAVKAHRKRMTDPKEEGGLGLASGEVEAYSNVARLARKRLSKRMEELTPRDTKMETEKLRQAEMDRRLFAKLGASNGYPMKEVIGALSQMQSYLDSNSTGMSEEARQQMQQAIAAGYAGLASTFLQKRQPTAQPGGAGQDEADTSLPEGMKEGDEIEHNGKRYTLGYKDGKPMWILKKNGGGVK